MCTSDYIRIKRIRIWNKITLSDYHISSVKCREER